ncbi:MAG: 30S ribosomal protein S2 [Bacteroidetes bacterium]|nr:30S ribosomal protein S2 [Bacteroidota bacterium]HET6243747.1 30S ribosomal protein S2 [Bacteroidia bacterium]
MSRVTYKELLESGVHFGHLKRKWNPNMAPYIFMEKNGIHIIDLNKTVAKLDEAANALKQIAKSGKKILFVATKKQAKDIVADKAKNLNMPYVTERWPGGMLTNFATIRKAIKKMSSIDRMVLDGTFENISKKERLQITRQRQKLETNLGSITDLTRLPAAIFIVDINKEHIAVAEAKKLNIPTFGIVDTNSDPRAVDFAIPANDDSSQSVNLVLQIISKAIEEGLSERKHDKETMEEEKAGKPVEEVMKENRAAAKAEDNVEDATEEEGSEKKKIAKSPSKEDSGKRPTTKKPIAKSKAK